MCRYDSQSFGLTEQLPCAAASRRTAGATPEQPAAVELQCNCTDVLTLPHIRRTLCNLAQCSRRRAGACCLRGQSAASRCTSEPCAACYHRYCTDPSDTLTSAASTAPTLDGHLCTARCKCKAPGVYAARQLMLAAVAVMSLESCHPARWARAGRWAPCWSTACTLAPRWRASGSTSGQRCRRCSSPASWRSSPRCPRRQLAPWTREPSPLCCCWCPIPHPVALQPGVCTDCWDPDDEPDTARRRIHWSFFCGHVAALPPSCRLRLCRMTLWLLPEAQVWTAHACASSMQ